MLDDQEAARFQSLTERLPELRERAQALEEQGPSPELDEIYSQTITLYDNLKDLCGDSPDILYNLARVHDKADHCEQARDLYSDLSQRNPEAGPLWAQVVPRAQENLVALESRQSCQLTLIITCPEQADTPITIDGEPAGTCPKSTQRRPPGTYTVATYPADHPTQTEKVKLSLSESPKSVNFDAPPPTTAPGEPGPATPSSGRITLAFGVAPSTGLVSGALLTRDKEPFRIPRELDGSQPALWSLVLLPELAVRVNPNWSVVGRARLDVINPSFAMSFGARRTLHWDEVFDLWGDVALLFGGAYLPVRQPDDRDTIYLSQVGPLGLRLGFGGGYHLTPTLSAIAQLDLTIAGPNTGVLLDAGVLGLRWRLF